MLLSLILLSPPPKKKKGLVSLACGKEENCEFIADLNLNSPIGKI